MSQTLATWFAQDNDPDKKRLNPDKIARAHEIALYEQHKIELKNARIALMKTGLSAEEVNLETLPGDIAGMVDATGITADPVIFRDLEFATQTLGHEQAHKNGIRNEALAELIGAFKSGGDVAPEYRTAVADFMHVANVIGLKTTIDLCEQDAYSWMFQIFVQKSGGNVMDYPDCVKLFEKAFPEVRVNMQTN
ncbi:MAG: hypothetical protein US89_C0010G0028 [Candidatus Peregrinibacteria bacterium GW2011_GWF2_38_29]|nr:MAG: hypothetical protein US89_C0010G0028 [Candidatus Peregrinibacteria bacterium GW2011_GWF2_38_29]HBB02350.1 hypothetical protein [Candidatus Peregrinibacteria bacterium]